MSNLAIILLIVSIICVFFMYYISSLRGKKQDPVLIDKPFSGKKTIEFDSSKIPPSMDGYSYTLMFWINIEDWEYKKNEWKHILHKGSAEGPYQPGIWIKPNTNDIVIRYSTEDKPGVYNIHKNKVFKSILNDDNAKKNYTLYKNKTIAELKEINKNTNGNGIVITMNNNIELTDTYRPTVALIRTTVNNDDELIDAPEKYYEEGMMPVSLVYNEASLSPTINETLHNNNHVTDEIRNIPLNKWTHITIVVNNNTREVYVNGLLKLSNIFHSAPLQNNGNIYVAQNSGFDGYLSQLKVYNRALSINKVKNIFNLGPTGILLPGLPEIPKINVPKIRGKITCNCDKVKCYNGGSD